VGAAAFDAIRDRLAGDAVDITETHGLLQLELAPEALARVVRALKDEFGFDMLTDLTAVDWPARQPRFDVVWHLYSTRSFRRVRLRTRVPEADPSVDSLVPLYGCAAFQERECHEMYGIVFRGNRDLRPLLLYEGFVGHPLRKDYPKEHEQPLVAYREQA
jgi:NADH-quinone oxidoreductase subunit C